MLASSAANEHSRVINKPQPGTACDSIRCLRCVLFYAAITVLKAFYKREEVRTNVCICLCMWLAGQVWGVWSMAG